MLTKKHYKAIAACINEHYEDSKYSTIVDERRVISIAKHLSDILYYDNPRFDRDKFLEACGINES